MDALVLSHPEQAARLRAACPEAAGSAVLGGDPCFDRMLAARHHRDRFRRALGRAPARSGAGTRPPAVCAVTACKLRRDN